MKTSKRFALVLSTLVVGLMLVAGFTSGVVRASVEEGSPVLAPLGVLVLINELDADQTGTDAAEFVELYDGGFGNAGLDVSVDKQGDTAGFAGELYTYAIEVRNTGIVTVTTILVTDTLPVNTTFDSAVSGAQSVTTSGNKVVFEYNNVYANAIEPILLTVMIDAGVPEGFVLTNIVTATADVSEDNTSNNVAQWSTTVYDLVPIATARAGNNGDLFAVEGQVIYTPGTFNSSGWALQDASGGIGVFYNPPPSANRNDVVRLVATRGSFSNEEQFTTPVYFFTNLGPGMPVTPMTYTTADVGAGLSEGWLVQIEGTISGLTACSGNYDFQVDDGSGVATVFVDVDTGVDVCALGAKNGDTVRVTGFSTQFNADYEVKPRDVNDIQLFLPIPVIGKDAPTQVAPGELYSYTITVQNFVGYTMTGVVITDIVPVDSAFAYAQDGGTETGGVVTWNAGDLSNQGSVTVRFAVTATMNSSTVILNEDYAISASNYATPTLGTPVGTLVFGAIGPACGDPAVLIHHIQGSGDTSPLAGTNLVIEGVVVGDYQDPSSGYAGFFIQEEDTDVDANLMTSEGIFVFYDTVDVQPGDLVRVFGAVHVAWTIGCEDLSGGLAHAAYRYFYIPRLIIMAVGDRHGDTSIAARGGGANCA